MVELTSQNVFKPRGSSKCYVMLVEADAETRRQLREPLLEDGFSVVEVESGEQAKEAIYAGDNPLVVEAALINVDKSDGLEAIAFFKREFPSVALVGMTGWPAVPEEGARMRVGLLGAGKGGSALLEILSGLPGVELVGICDKSPQAPALARARELGIPVLEDPLRLIGAEGTNLVIDVTGDPAMERLIAEHKRPGTEVLGGMASKLFWTLLQHEMQMRDHIARTERLAEMVKQGVMGDYLVKPVKPETLIRTVGNAWAHRPVLH